MPFGPRFFFFQAEDCIRYRDVTGVQTCALPISAAPTDPRRDGTQRSTRRRGDAENWFVLTIWARALDQGSTRISAPPRLRVRLEVLFREMERPWSAGDQGLLQTSRLD